MITVEPKGFLTLESEEGVIVNWLWKTPYKLEKYRSGYLEIECHIGNKREFITLSDGYAGQIMELFIELKVCPLCGEYMPKNYDYCFWCDGWMNESPVYINEDKDRTRGKRKYKKHVKLKHKINLYRDKKDNKSVDYYLETSNFTKLFKWKIKHDCDYCQRGRQHSNKKRETSLIEKLNEYNSTKGAE